MAWNPNVPTVTNRVQDDLNAIRENFRHLDPLAPYVQALLDSRIVDHNLDVADPPNGRYVRWENGLQICWGNPKNTFPGGGSTNLQYHMFPATFVSTPVVTYSTVGYSHALESHGIESPTATKFESYIKQVDTNARTYTVFYVAIGMWK